MNMIHFRWIGSVALAGLLVACASSPGSSSRTEHFYAFGQKPQPAGQAVAPVTVDAVQPGQGPQHLTHIVYFDYDDDRIRPSERPIVEGHAEWMRQNPDRSVVLQGHTDVRGGSEYNLALGHRRAQSVAQALQMLGVQPSRIETVSYGKERLLDTGMTEQAHQRNRRVEFDYR